MVLKILSCILEVKILICIRVGIDRSKYIKVVDYVLSRFTKDEQDAINQGIENASDAVIDYLDHGFNHAMNRFN